MNTRILPWLETRWVAPSFSGLVLSGLALFFFLAATNTMAGWLYVISGVLVSLLTIAALLSRQTLAQIQLSRRPILPISAGETLTVELLVQNSTSKRKELLQVEDLIPSVLGEPVRRVVETLAAHGTHYWVYEQPVAKRGIYRWHSVRVRTAAPLGLFWCRQEFGVSAIATVYPTVLPLSRCPLIDELGQDTSLLDDHRRTQAATEGLTRSLRPYRWGDSTRLIHWRTSARYGELRVRELETLTSGQEMTICLDSTTSWDSEAFEQAVVAAASLYFYAIHQTINIRVWTAGSGVIAGNQAVLETLAAITPAEETQIERLPMTSLIWLTQNPLSLHSLPNGSRWILWNDRPKQLIPLPGLVIQPEQPTGAGRNQSLQRQLQNDSTSS
ncbi:MAG: DUF58 domain-containing protein [Myxacorys californica WJT36-NPBG1]|jgi:uncharacterized protein (DUF58 family)|nr:DUF58 domain-containing protein [Myxacorys californica WJT36-NPBG1]